MSGNSTYDNFSPTDYRYRVDELKPFLSEEAFVHYKAMVEEALARVQYKNGMISASALTEIEYACSNVAAEEVYAEEEKTRHDIIALRNVIQRKLKSDEAKSAVHRFATSYDIVETSNAARYRDAFEKVIIPDMVELEKIWIEQVRKEGRTVQIGRTHLQHAEPITYGFSLAWYISRFGDRIVRTHKAASELKGKFSGSVGAYNASSLFLNEPLKFEEEIMNEVNVEPAEISTQIAPPEPVTDLVHYTISAFGILANWADDMRNLQRPEVAEVGQPRGSKDTSASSIMPHKVNPVGLENIKSLWKATMPLMTMMYLDQISDHQRDLTNSASQRYVPAIFDQFDYAVRRARRIAGTLQPHKYNMEKNLNISANKIISEPLQTTLSYYGHPHAHSYVEELVKKSEETKIPLTELVFDDPSLKGYIVKFTEEQLDALKDPSSYVGIAPEKSRTIANRWEKHLRKLKLTV